MDWWMWPLMYLVMTAVTGRLMYRFGNWGSKELYGEEYDYKSGRRVLVYRGKSNGYDDSTIAWSSIGLGLAWPVMLMYGAVYLGNSTKVDRGESRDQQGREKAIELREREIRVVTMEKELGIREIGR